MWVHCLPGRTRARLPELIQNPRLAGQIVQRALALTGVTGASANPATGSLLVTYDPARVSLSLLTEWLFPGQAQAQAEAEVAVALAADAPAPAVCQDQQQPRLGQLVPLDSTAPGGLTTAEVHRRLAAYGPNQLREPPRPSFLARLLDQYRDAMQLTLVAGAGVSFLSGHRRDGLTILGVLLLNGLIGAAQAGQASRSLGALRKLTPATAQAVRDGVPQEVEAAGLVPGDLLLLEAGDRVPADAEIRESHGLAIDEAMLTGESAAVEKAARGDTLHAGTAVVRGRAMAVVTATGMSSALGRVGGLFRQADRPAPLQQHLDGLGRKIARAGIWLAAGAAGLGLLRGQGLVGALLAGISLAISAMPEGLPTFVTLALASGARQLASRGGSFQNLGAVETTGSLNVLCCDKTGTLTRGEMVVSEIQTLEATWQVDGQGYDPAGEFRRDGKPVEPLADPALRRMLKVATLCTTARIGLDQQGALVTHGDTTEIALLVAALKAGLRAQGGEGDRVLEVPFDSARRCMTVVVRDQAGQAVACVKGAPEAILPGCTRIQGSGEVSRLTDRLRRRMERSARAMAERGLRVLAVAFRPVPLAVTPDEAESGLVLLGLIGLNDPPRSEAAETVSRCDAAGVRVVMITGDHPATAAAIARQLGLPAAPENVLSGDQLARLNDAGLASVLPRLHVVARATPVQKLRIIRALRESGQRVAMVGDGVNDAPAMQEADLGVAMGLRGTEVARASADLVLEDDDLRTLVAAIAQGRATSGNIRRVARYLLGSNAAEVCLMATSLLLGLPLPLLPIQLLFMNLVGDILPATALGAEPPSSEEMQRAPQHGRELLGPDFSRKVLGHGLKMGLVASGVYAWALVSGQPLGMARSLAMATLAAGQVRHLLACRSRVGSPQIRTAGWIAAGLSLSALYLPPLRNALQFTSPGPAGLAVATGVALAAGG